MPTYTYKNCCGDENINLELNVPISKRDEQTCVVCDNPLQRTISFTGLTWAPTAGGMR